jgi:hypothetical protein
MGIRCFFLSEGSPMHNQGPSTPACTPALRTDASDPGLRISRFAAIGIFQLVGILNCIPCLLPIFAVLFPRLVMVCIALFTTWFSAAFSSVLWPLLGFIFMPYTTLAYMAAMLNNNHSANGGWLALIVVAAIVDLGGQGGSARRKRRRS